MDWHALGRQTFESIVDTLLAREFGERGHAINGRGGDEGVDFEVDGREVIFQYKFFPDGFPSGGAPTPSRRKQIRRSFERALAHQPRTWILVVPVTLTGPERLFVTGLGRGKSVKVEIRDLTWLTDALARNPDLANHYRFASEADYLFERGEALRNNPVVRDVHDATVRLQQLQDDIDVADPNYTIDHHVIDGQITHFLRARDPGAVERSPITISFTAQLPTDSPEASALARANAFGYTESIVLPGETVSEFEVSGTRLLGPSGQSVERLELHPLPGQESPWRHTELVFADEGGLQIGQHLAEARVLATGFEGLTLQTRVGQLVELKFRMPTQDEGTGAGAEITTGNVGGSPVRDALEAAEFIQHLVTASTLELRAEGRQLALLNVEGRLANFGSTDAFTVVRQVAEDLLIIEGATGCRFRFPTELTTEDRILTRCLRLMLEGHCVAHPTYNQLAAELNGTRDAGLEAILTTEPAWIRCETAPATFTLLGQELTLPSIAFLGLVRLDTAQLERLHKALREGRGAGQEIKWTLLPEQSVRMYLPDRFDPHDQLTVTAWDIAGVEEAMPPETLADT